MAAFVSGAYFWLILTLVMVIIELATVSLTTIWFAIGSAVAALSVAFTHDFGIQTIIFLTVSLLLLIFTRPVAKRKFNSKTVKTNVDSIIGSLCLVTEEINNIEETGAVKLNGMDWSARSTEEEKIIEPGTTVKVESVKGVHLYVTDTFESEDKK